MCSAEVKSMTGAGLVPIAAAAKELNKPVDEIRRLIKNGGIKGYNLGSCMVPRYYVDLALLKEFIKKSGEHHEY